jgi:hypothetical protein
MIKTTYFCDCCKQVIPDDADHIQMVPMNETVDAFTGALSGYEKMVDAHFCRACTDRIISFMFQPVDIDALQKSLDEDKTIIDTLNAELEEAKQTQADPEEVRLLKNKNEELIQKNIRQKNLIDQLRLDIERLETTGKTKPDEPPITILTPEEVEAEQAPPAKASVKKKIWGGTPAIDKVQVYRMHRDGLSYSTIAARFGCHPSRIGQIVKEMREAEKKLPDITEETNE